MKPTAIALPIIFGIILVGAVTGVYAGFRRQMNLEQWTVAGRGFGLIFVWLLMAGEVYTTFAFLGASGWAYSRGGPTLYILAYLTLAYVLSFFVLPRIWEMGRRFSLHTQSDFFRQRYNSQLLASTVAIVGVVFIIPYLQLQLTGLGIIVQVASFDGISRPLSITIAFVIVAGFVLSSGIRAVAWVSVLKDSLMLLAAFIVGIGVPYHYFGGIGSMYQPWCKPRRRISQCLAARRIWVTAGTYRPSCSLQLADLLASHVRFDLHRQERRHAAAQCGHHAAVQPHAAAAVFRGLFRDSRLAWSEERRHGFAADGAANVFPLVIGAGRRCGRAHRNGAGSYSDLTAGTLFAKNFFRPLFAPSMSDDSVAKLAKLMVVVITAAAMYFALFSSTSLVGLLLFAYSGIAQFAPGVALGLYWSA